MQISSKIFLLLFLTTCALVAQDQIAVDKIIGPTTGVVEIQTHIGLGNNTIIYGEDTGGTDQRIVYWDNANDVWIGPDAALGAVPSGGDVILRALSGTPLNTEVSVELDGNPGVTNAGSFAPSSGDTITLGTASVPWSYTYLADVLELSDSDGAGFLQPTFTLYADDSAGGSTRLRSSATTNYFLSFPASLPASTECLEVTSGGQIQAAGAACGSGSASSGTNDEIQITDNAGGFTSVANFRYDSTVSHPSLNLPLHITFQTDSGFDIGEAGTRPDEIFADNMITEEVFFRRQGAGSHDFLFQAVSSSVLQIQNSASVNLIVIDEAVDQHIEFNRDIMPTSTGAFIDIGETGKYFDEIWASFPRAVTGFLPDAPGGAYVGTRANYFTDVWGGSLNGLFEVSVYDQGSITAREADFDSVLAEMTTTTVIGSTETGQVVLSNELTSASATLDGLGQIVLQDASGVFFFASGPNLFLGTNGTVAGSISLYHQTTAGTVGLRTANVTGSVGLELTQETYPILTNTYDLGVSGRTWRRVRAGTAFVGPSGADGTSTTLTCGAGQAVKNITISGGVVTSASCGAP